ncbi:MAG TPA: hypothetical protein VMD08_10515 [Candidatus Baltobacteraceae bacterium]|nr:hypothetical protein [Candidatus Baltobacteraceae bacterium]
MSGLASAVANDGGVGVIACADANAHRATEIVSVEALRDTLLAEYQAAAT